MLPVQFGVQMKNRSAGITAIAAFGHSPGQMAREISSTEQHLLFVADAIVHPLHLEYPETIGATDHRPTQMVATRLTLLEKAAREISLVSASNVRLSWDGACSTEGRNVGVATDSSRRASGS